MYVKIKHALSITLAVIMAVTTFACCSFSASAEGTTSTLYEGYTWSPMRGITAVAGDTVNETKTITDMPIDEANALKATEYSIERVDNQDGTVTGYKVTTTNKVTANEDGTTATVVKTIKMVPTIIDNPAVENGDVFKFGIYSDRETLKGYFYVSELNPYEIYPIGNYGGGFGTPGSGDLTLNSQHTIKLVGGNDNVARSFYMTMSQVEEMKDIVIFGIRQYNGMALSFVAPEDGVYSADGLIGKVTNHSTKYPYADDNVKFYVAKLDENGVEHALSETAVVPIQSEDYASIPNTKVKLKKGEALVVRTVNNTGFLGKVFVENFLVTKWDYAEADDKSTVTVNYAYQNQNFMNVYGADYDIANDNNFNTLWKAEAARYSLDRTKLLDTTPFDALYTSDTMVRAYVKNSEFTSQVRQDYGAAITYKSDGTIWAKADIRSLNETVTEEDGTETVVTNNYRYGPRLTFTVPEKGNVQLIGGLDNNTANLVERVGIIKAGSNEIEYLKYFSYSGEKVDWVTCKHSSTQLYRVYNLDELNAGDKIVYEISHLYASPSNGFERVRLDHLSVNITTSNSEIDFNGDFKMNATDAAYLRKVIIKNVIPRDVMMFNITEDDKVDIRDLVRIKKLLAGITVE